MIRHLFTLIWNRKKQNFLMITEIFFSFIVLFGVLSLGFFYLDNYRKPLGFNYDKVWVMSLRWNQETPEQVRAIQSQLKQQFKSNNEVAEVALASFNVPYTMNTSNGAYSYQGRTAHTHFYEADRDYAKVMQLQLTQGRWFDNQDFASNYNPVVITESLREELFPGEKVIGKVVQNNSEDKTAPQDIIVGVVNAYRSKGEYSPDAPGLFRLNDAENAKKDQGQLGNIVIRVKPGVTSAFEEKLMKQANQIAKGWTMELETMAEMRTSDNKITLIPLIIFSIVCGFLIINVALGLFGVLWYNINRRISEIGLRRAIGAASGQVYRQFIGEVLVLATFGIIIGVVIALQFPLLKVFGVQTSVYLAAMVASVIIIYLLAAGCAAYPSRQAAVIQPASALHEE